MRYAHSNDETEDLIYVKENIKFCNNQPVYKSKDQPSYIFKSIGDYWCDQYIPSSLIDCKSDCTEIRFKVIDWKQSNVVVPEELELQGLKFTWIPKTAHKIVCLDNSMAFIEKALVTSTTTTTTTKITSAKTHEELLNEKLGQLLIARNNYFNTGKGELTLYNLQIL